MLYPPNCLSDTEVKLTDLEFYVDVVDKVYKRLYLLKRLMDLVDTFPDVRYWSDLLRCISPPSQWLEGHGLGLVTFILKFLIKVFKSIYLLTCLMDPVDTLPEVR